MGEVSTIDLDIAKSVVHGVAAAVRLRFMPNRYSLPRQSSVPTLNSITNGTF